MRAIKIFLICLLSISAFAQSQRIYFDKIKTGKSGEVFIDGLCIDPDRPTFESNQGNRYRNIVSPQDNVWINYYDKRTGELTKTMKLKKALSETTFSDYYIKTNTALREGVSKRFRLKFKSDKYDIKVHSEGSMTMGDNEFDDSGLGLRNKFKDKYLGKSNRNDLIHRDMENEFISKFKSIASDNKLNRDEQRIKMRLKALKAEYDFALQISDLCIDNDGTLTISPALKRRGNVTNLPSISISSSSLSISISSGGNSIELQMSDEDSTPESKCKVTFEGCANIRNSSASINCDGRLKASFSLKGEVLKAATFRL